MEILNLIGSICSILSLLIAIFLASQVIKIKNKIKDNSENIVNQKRIKTGGGDIAGRDIK
ncbi:MAG: hypothetical protein IPK88_00070 [Saprospiraceae bacterium]|nr:hypothetical protein [Candidatus Defluviibacterium haderslevense]